MLIIQEASCSFRHVRHYRIGMHSKFIRHNLYLSPCVSACALAGWLVRSFVHRGLRAAPCRAQPNTNTTTWIYQHPQGCRCLTHGKIGLDCHHMLFNSSRGLQDLPTTACFLISCVIAARSSQHSVASQEIRDGEETRTRTRTREAEHLGHPNDGRTELLFCTFLSSGSTGPARTRLTRWAGTDCHFQHSFFGASLAPSVPVSPRLASLRFAPRLRMIMVRETLLEEEKRRTWDDECGITKELAHQVKKAWGLRRRRGSASLVVRHNFCVRGGSTLPLY